MREEGLNGFLGGVGGLSSARVLEPSRQAGRLWTGPNSSSAAALLPRRSPGPQRPSVRMFSSMALSVLAPSWVAAVFPVSPFHIIAL